MPPSSTTLLNTSRSTRSMATACSSIENNSFQIIQYDRTFEKPNLAAMKRKLSDPSATLAAKVGLLALASAMGIGRFSLTPILPLMQHDVGLTFAQGGWLATANYLGYLAGALICMASAPQPVRAIRWGLICVAVLTLAVVLSRRLQFCFPFRFWCG